MSAIKNIIFDLGGVILDIDIDRTHHAFREMGLEKIEDLFGYGHAASFFKDHEQGKISDEDFIAQVQKLIPGSESLAIRKAWNAMLLEFPAERIEYLRDLRKTYRLFLFSNTNGIHLEAFSMLYNSGSGNGKLDELFDKAYYSHLMGLRKPDKESFEFILKENNLLPEETLFVDDAAINIRGAEEAGLQTFHLQKGMDLRAISRKL